jgi:hypothetical protein
VGAPPWWGCHRGRFCDYAHGEDELRGEGAIENRKAKADAKKFKDTTKLDAAYVASRHIVRAAARLRRPCSCMMVAAVVVAFVAAPVAFFSFFFFFFFFVVVFIAPAVAVAAVVLMVVVRAASAASARTRRCRRTCRTACALPSPWACETPRLPRSGRMPRSASAR